MKYETFTELPHFVTVTIIFLLLRSFPSTFNSLKKSHPQRQHVGLRKGWLLKVLDGVRFFTHREILKNRIPR